MKETKAAMAKPEAEEKVAVATEELRQQLKRLLEAVVEDDEVHGGGGGGVEILKKASAAIEAIRLTSTSSSRSNSSNCDNDTKGQRRRSSSSSSSSSSTASSAALVKPINSSATTTNQSSVTNKKGVMGGGGGERLRRRRREVVVVPEQFLYCPISGELMRDPVVVSTGQTYDRAFIEAWLEAGNRTCPRTREVLTHMTLTPNHLVHLLISQCPLIHHQQQQHHHHLLVHDLPRSPPQINSTSVSNINISTTNNVVVDDDDDDDDDSNISTTGHDDDHLHHLLNKLLSSYHHHQQQQQQQHRQHPNYNYMTISDQQKAAAKELREVTKKVPSIRAIIFQYYPNAITHILSPLFSPDLPNHPDLHEDVVTTILNLSILDDNKRLVGDHPHAIPLLIDALTTTTATTETCSNAAAALFTLSALDSNKAKIGQLGAMSPLFALLEHRANKDAASAIFGLCVDRENRARAVRGGAVGVLLRMIEGNINIINDGRCMVDESLAILAMLASDRGAAEEIGRGGGVKLMLGIIRDGWCRRNHENAAVVLFSACAVDRSRLRLREVAEEEEKGLTCSSSSSSSTGGCISWLAHNGSTRARRKATGLLDRIHRMNNNNITGCNCNSSSSSGSRSTAFSMSPRAEIEDKF